MLINIETKHNNMQLKKEIKQNIDLSGFYPCVAWILNRSVAVAYATVTAG